MNAKVPVKPVSQLPIGPENAFVEIATSQTPKLDGLLVKGLALLTTRDPNSPGLSLNTRFISTKGILANVSLSF
jgi:hypothetical protein